MQRKREHGLSLWLTIWLLLANTVFVGILANDVLVVRADLTAGKALSFDGVDDYVEVPDSASLAPSEITIEAWIYPLSWTHAPTAVVIAAKRTVNTNGYMFFWFATTQTITIDLGGNTQRWNTGYNPPLNTWTHLAYTFSSVDKGKFYVNGIVYATTTLGASPASTAPLRIAMDSITPQYWFKGSIDEVRIYDRPCTATEISRHYSLGIGEYGRTEAGLSGLWHFDNDSNDYSGLDNNGAVSGALYADGHVPLPDVAVLNVSLQTTEVVRGGIVPVNVTTKNVGAGAYENFTVTLYGNSTVIETKPVTGLLSQSSDLLTFMWDTTSFSPGIYTIKAEASSVQGETNTGNNIAIDGTVLVFLANPEAAFTYAPSTPVIDQAVTFNASISTPGAGTIASYTWNFSDGTLTTIDQPTTLHAFTEYGTYNVTLTVVNTYGMSDETWSLITVSVCPKARFTCMPIVPLKDETVTFDASTSTPGAGVIAVYCWNFDDGTPIMTTDQPITAHIFTQRGTYNVTLTVTDTQPLNDTTWASVNIALHDLAAIDLLKSKTVVGQGFPVCIGIKVQNGGDFTEDSSIAVYANQIVVYETTFTIPSMSYKIINFTLDTTSLDKGSYVLGFIVSPVQSETNTTNNTFMGIYHMKFLYIAMVGDVAGGSGTFPNTTPDGKVDIKDLAMMAKCYGAVYSGPDYYPNYDLNDDGKIDIKDLAMAAKNYGKVDP